MFVKNVENKGNFNLFVFVLPTCIMIKIVDGYKMVDGYYTGDNRRMQLLVASSFKMTSIWVRCIRGPNGVYY